MHGSRQAAEHRTRVACRPDEEAGERPCALGVRHIHLRRLCLGHPELPHVGHDADNLGRGRRRRRRPSAVVAQATAHRALTREISIRERLADHHHRRRIETIGFTDPPAVDEPQSHHRGVGRPGRQVNRERLRARGRQWLAINRKPSRRAHGRHRRIRAGCGGRHTWDLRETFDHALDETHAIRRLHVTAHRQADLERDHVLTSKSRIDGDQTRGALQQQPGGGQQHHRGAHFHADQRLTHPHHVTRRRVRALSAADGRGPGGAARDEPAQCDRRHGHQSGEEHDRRRTERRSLDLMRRHQPRELQQPQQPGRHADRRHRGDRREHEMFDQQLSREPRCARAQGGADR